MTSLKVRSENALSIHQKCAVFKIDLSGQIVFIDSSIEQLFGFPQEKLYTRSIKDFLDEDSYSVLKSIIEKKRSFEVSYEPVDLTYLGADGRKLYRKSIVSLNYSAGNPANYQIIVLPEENVEPRRIEVSNVNEAYDDTASELNTENQIVTENQYDSFFNAVLAEFENHLARIGESLDILTGQFSRELKGYGQEYLDSINGSQAFMESAIERINKMLELIREADTSDNVDLNRVVHDVLDHLGVEYPSVRFHFNDFNLPLIKSDNRIIGEVFKLILENSFQYRNPDMDIEISFEYTETDKYLELTVSDNGSGISESIADRVMEPFVSHPVFVGTKGSGMGLGLALADNLIQKIGGRISPVKHVESGARFVIELSLWREYNV